jgi:hypothetical protein
MTDIQRAMLGDHEAAARLTEQGVLLECPKTRPFKFSNEMEDWEYHG